MSDEMKMLLLKYGAWAGESDHRSVWGAIKVAASTSERSFGKSCA